MKKISIFIAMLLSIVLTAGCSSSRLTKAEKASMEAAVREALDNRQFTVEVNYVLPSNGKAHFLSSQYELTIDHEMINSYLPFFGRAYNIPYDGGKGLIFKSTISEYVEKRDETNKTMIKIKTSNDEDRYDYYIEVFPSGKANITVMSMRRQQIAFQGELKLKT